MKTDPLVRDKALADLKDMLPPGTPVYTVLSHVSASGMTRGIKVLAIETYMGKQVIADISWMVARVLDRSLHPKGGVKEHGCGMDMGFHVVYCLSAALYGHDDRGGYQLKQQWL